MFGYAKIKKKADVAGANSRLEINFSAQDPVQRFNKT
jgi:hypothetical protein